MKIQVMKDYWSDHVKKTDEAERDVASLSFNQFNTSSGYKPIVLTPYAHVNIKWQDVLDWG